jgi:hypothetical protein
MDFEELGLMATMLKSYGTIVDFQQSSFFFLRTTPMHSHLGKIKASRDNILVITALGHYRQPQMCGLFMPKTFRETPFLPACGHCCLAL